MNKLKGQFKSYGDHRGKLDNWLIAHDTSFDYAKKLCSKFNIVAKPRFYILKSDTFLPPHKDHGTLCSINVLLNFKNSASVNFNNKKYTYKSCLLNTQNAHSVNNKGCDDRLLFKLSIFNESYKSVSDKIKKTIG